MSSATVATKHTISANAAVADEVDFKDTRDFDDAQRGFICALPKPVVKTDSGKTIVDLSERVKIFDGVEQPSSVNPSLWREMRIVAPYGLFKVVDGVYQVVGGGGNL